MPWKTRTEAEARRQMIQGLLRGHKSVKESCQIYGVSRKTIYKWRARFLTEGDRGLRARSRRPHQRPRQIARRWIKRIKQLRQRRRTWGPKKLRVKLLVFGQRPPSVRTIGRWLKRLKLVRPQRRRPRLAFRYHPPQLTIARHANHVWTVDFKGWFLAGNGERCEPLTVRDLRSHYGLSARVMSSQQVGPVKAVFTKLFKRFGLPLAIRQDNGGPFTSSGPAGLSRLSAWWVSLGIRVEFTRPAHPQDNGSHEQFHRVLKAETASPAAVTRRGQQHRSTCWLKDYNTQRPHEELKAHYPSKHYKKSPRRLPQKAPTPHYGRKYAVRRVRSNGQIKWGGRKRFIGEAFIGQQVGLRLLEPGIQEVKYFHIVIGHLHEREIGPMRPALYHHVRRLSKKPKVSPMC